jgi:preprotein translocase SecF subunit
VKLSFLHHTNIDFIGKRYFFFVLSVLIALAGLVSLVVHGGPNYGIDFSGGVLVQISSDKEVALDKLRNTLNLFGVEGVELQSSQNSIIVRAKKSEVTQDEFAVKISSAFNQNFPQVSYKIDRVEYVGPAVGRHLFKQAFLAMFFSMLGIIIYVALRFRSGIWGVAGVLGIAHDVFVIFGIFSLFNKEITLTVIAALLTIAGFSINDTIVVFDRIRENMRLSVKESFGAIINKSVNQTLSRTVITSLTVFIVSLTLFFVGGEVIHDFAFAMLVGVFVGTYSSIYVCSPLVYEWEMHKRNKTALSLKK